MDELNIKNLEEIQIPEGLEERLSLKIDEWERAEKSAKQVRQHRIMLPAIGRWASVAACLALLLGVGFHSFFTENNPVELTAAEEDTFHDPQLARAEAERAFQLLAANLNKGMMYMEKAEALSNRAGQTMTDKLNQLNQQ